MGSRVHPDAVRKLSLLYLPGNIVTPCYAARAGPDAGNPAYNMESKRRGARSIARDEEALYAMKQTMNFCPILPRVRPKLILNTCTSHSFPVGWFSFNRFFYMLLF